MALQRHMLNDAPAAQAELKLVDQVGPRGHATSGAEDGLNRSFGGFALQDGSPHAYNEEAFQYFLEIERRRSEISNRPFLLMLVDFKRHPGIIPRIDARAAGKVFSILSACLRETDFVGWYREGRVTGAVLTQHEESESEELAAVVRRRVVGELEKQLPSDLALGLQVRVYQLSPHVKFSE